MKQIQELEQELEFQKKRFSDSSASVEEHLKQHYAGLDSALQLIRNHPLQTATVLFLGGLIISQLRIPSDIERI